MTIFSGQYELNGLRRLDPQVIGAVYDAYYPEVYRFVRYRVDDEALTEEIASQVFIRLIEGVKSGWGPQTILKAWLLGSASRIIADYLRQFDRRPPGEAPDLAPGVEQQGQARPLRRLMSALGGEQQDVLALRLGQGYSLEETAGLMKKNVNAVKQLQCHALAALARCERLALSDQLCEAVENCLQFLEQGIGLEICLARFPRQASELRPILEMAWQARAAAIRNVPSEAMQAGRARVLRRAAGMREQERRPSQGILAWLKPESWSHALGTTFTSLATAVFLVTGGPGLIYTSSGLLPAAHPYSAKDGSIGKQMASSLPVFAPVSVSMPAALVALESDQKVVDPTGARLTTQPADRPKPKPRRDKPAPPPGPAAGVGTDDSGESGNEGGGDNDDDCDD
jgi:RNA polymerase sigma-70 factor (ECF subfamily)